MCTLRWGRRAAASALLRARAAPPSLVGEPASGLGSTAGLATGAGATARGPLPPWPPPTAQAPAPPAAARRLRPSFCFAFARTSFTPHALHSVLGPAVATPQATLSIFVCTSVAKRHDKDPQAPEPNKAKTRRQSGARLKRAPSGPSRHCGVREVPHCAHVLVLAPPKPGSTAPYMHGCAVAWPCGKGASPVRRCLPAAPSVQAHRILRQRSASGAAGSDTHTGLAAGGGAAHLAKRLGRKTQIQPSCSCQGHPWHLRRRVCLRSRGQHAVRELDIQCLQVI